MMAYNENKQLEIINIYATVTTSVQKITAQPIFSRKKNIISFFSKIVLGWSKLNNK